jgi:hypothetical protein
MWGGLRPMRDVLNRLVCPLLALSGHEGLWSAILTGRRLLTIPSIDGAYHRKQNVGSKLEGRKPPGFHCDC